MANTLRFKRGLASGIPTALAGEPLFTTDTFDLYIGNGTTNTRFQKYIASGATTQILRGDGSLYTFPLAISSPSNGQVLKYNGTSWVNDSDAGITGSGSAGQVAYFTGATTQAGSNNLFWDATNSRLGIGTNTPSTRLYVTSPSANTTFDSGSATDARLEFRRAGTRIGYLNWDSGVVTLQADSGNYLGFNAGGSERARIFATGNFGIGTGATDSGEKLQVTGTMKVTGAASIGSTISISGTAYTLLALNNTNAVDWGTHISFAGNGTVFGYFGSVGSLLGNTTKDLTVYATAGNGFRVYTNGNNLRATIDASGNLGLGVTPSAWSGVRALQVGAAASLAGFTPTGEGMYLSSNAFFNGSSWIYQTSAFASQYVQLSSIHRWYTAPSGTAGNAITFTQAMTLDASGNLGVGTTSPSRRLSVVGTTDIISYSNGTTTGYLYSDNNGVGLFNGATATGTGIYARTSNILDLYYNGNIGLRLNNLGRVLIGSTGDSGEQLQVTGTAKITGASTFNTSVTSPYFLATGTLPAHQTNAGVFQYFSNGVSIRAYGATAGTGFIRFLTGGGGGSADTERMVIDATGNVAVDTNTLFVDATNNRVGIGTVSPAVALEIAGASTQQVRVTSTSGADMRINADTVGRVGTYSNSNLAVITNSAAIATFFTTGNLALNSVTDSGERLQVTGTAKITGASTFGGNVVISLNQNASTNFNVTNTDVGVNTKSEYVLVSRNGGTTKFGRYSNLTTAYKFINASDSYVLNETLGDFAILNDVASGNIKFAAGGSSTAHLTIASTGKVLYAAATTAKAQINLASGTAPTTPVDGDIWFDGTNLKMQIGGVTKTFTLI